MLELNRLYHMDCIEGMEQIPDKYFELAIVDPPYGIDFNGVRCGRFERYGGINKANNAKPTTEYFAELFRVSQNQIIWGYNHLSDMLPKCREFIFWDKGQPAEVTFAAGELAYTSFRGTARKITIPIMGAFKQENGIRIHPTQKPVALYKWLLDRYAKEGDKILDTHVGSASSLIACYELGFEFMGFEIDEGYYVAATKRLSAVMAQTSLFDRETIQA